MRIAEPAWGDLVRGLAPRFVVRVGSREYPLTVPVVFGRAPSAPRIRDGRMPRLVPLDSPAGHLSATHCEIRQDGSAVIVTDLRSTNGCVVVLPGSAPRRLRQRESMAVTPGTIIDLAGEAILQVVATEEATS